ncbi:hypothetical protein [Aquimarina algiphila]|uniref:hypothetical protein n=1 Tax=Aquimarina algiphila TaxID=2047982 RepID=UPI00232D7CD8|nr:hypothetical protein [Aquimarina algiphila]
MNTIFKIVICFIVFTFSASAQKVKVKNGIILIDKVEIPIKVDSEYKTTNDGTMGDFHQVLTFSNMSTSNTFLIIDYKGKMMTPNGPKETWLEIFDTKKEKTNSVDIDNKYGGGKKGIIKHLLFKYEFFSTKGEINQNKIATFFNTQTESKAKAKVNKISEQKTQSVAKVNEIRPFVQNDLMTIIKGGRFGTDLIGKVEAPDKYHETRNTPIKIYDLDNNLIAKAITDILSPVIVTAIDGSVFEYRNKYQLSGGLANQKFLTELMENLIGNGFELGHSYNNKLLENQAVDDEAYRSRRKEQNKEFERRLAKAYHFFEKKGYVITKDGEKIEGPITIFFEKVAHPNNTISHVINGVSYETGDGTVLSIKVKDESGKLMNKRFKAKENVSFAVFGENGKEIVFKSITMINNLFKDWRFHEYIETHNEVEIFKSYKKNLILNRLDKEKAYYVDYKISFNSDDKSKSERNSELRSISKLYEYLCDEHDTPIEKEKIDKNKVLELFKNQFSENKIKPVRDIIDITKDCFKKK